MLLAKAKKTSFSTSLLSKNFRAVSGKCWTILLTYFLGTPLAPTYFSCHVVQDGFQPCLATYGSVWNTDQWILHGFSIRKFEIFDPATICWTPGFQILFLEGSSWAGDLLEQRMGPEQTYFVEEMVPLGVEGDLCEGFVL